MKKLIAYLLLFCLPCRGADVVLGKFGDITFAGDGTNMVAAFGGGAPAYWTGDYNNIQFLHDWQSTNGAVAVVARGTTNYNGLFQPSFGAGPTITYPYTNQYGRAEGICTFDGSDDSFFTPDLSGLIGVTALTYCAWLKVQTQPANYCASICVRDAEFFAVAMIQTAPYKIEFQPELNFLVDGNTIGTNQWMFVCCTWSTNYNSGKANLYTNGIVDNAAYTSARTTALPTGYGIWRIGEDPYSTRNWAGSMGEVMFYTNRILSSNEQYDIYTHTHPTNNLRAR